MTDLTIQHDSKVELIDVMGDDLRIQLAARVSTGKDALDEDLKEGLIRYLVSSKHTSTLEHCTATFVVDTPIFVAREFMRHRTMSYNEVSARYTKMQPSFYIPSPERPLVNAGTSARPELVSISFANNLYKKFVLDQIAVYEHAWEIYDKYIDLGFANEVCRNVLPVGIMTRFYVTANLNNWMKFLTLRDGLEGHPQWEIVQVANQIKRELKNRFPVAMKYWTETRAEIDKDS